MTNFLAQSRVASVPTRMGPDLRSAIERHPALAGLALWVAFADRDEPGLIAATDGRTVWAGQSYAGYSEKERVFILLHELLHVALAHPLRARQLRKRHDDFDALAYNIACDALINAALEGAVGLVAPSDSIALQPLLTQLELWPENAKVGEIVRRWSSEALYQAIMQKRDRVITTVMLDIREGEGGQPLETDAAAQGQVREWSRRLSLARGLIPGVLERLTGEIPQVKTPWERVLRDQLYRRLGRRHLIDFSRPTRRWLGLEHDLHRREGVALPFEPDRTRPGPSGRVAVAVDTSGSIDNTVLARFTGEIASIMAHTASQLLLIVCDAEVHAVEELEGHRGQLRLRQLRYKGGGGTDFKPAIAAAAYWRPDVLVYLTDLMGDAGEPPSFPVVWALPPGLPQMTPPWGVLIELD